MFRASTPLGLLVFAFACALGCKPSTPPSTTTATTTSAAPTARKWSIKSGEPLRDADIPPTVTACAAGELDDETFAAFVQRLADAADRRGEPCFIKALKDYKPESGGDAVVA